ncbi:surA N-terminal domain protein [Anaplasma phagocytophilum str. ApMUC09]|uniref:SurA N-terminal domain protein n=1 Tax=Anaplasma phagocytophilum str. ApMUC09 TaxID=1359152 RepID=A0A0F3N9G0_ANAPH|nr:surA N-terminal domain protein [Anaplasma phagocytophilum str. ApMUC09]
MMSRWFPWLCFLCLVIPCGKGCASVKIEAVVDDKVLTSLDVDRREHANGFFYKTAYAEGNRREVLGLLIDEVILELEAKQLGITVEKQEVAQEVERLFSVLGVCSGLSLDECAAGNGLDAASIESHVRSRVIWSKILSTRVAPFLSVADDEVSQYVAEAKSDALETVLDLEQVFVPFRAGAVLDSVASELHKGVELTKIAERYREHGVYVDRTMGASAVGFVHDVKVSLLRAKEGSIIGPVRIDKGHLLLKLLSKVRVKKRFMNSVVSMKQLSVPVKEAGSILDDLRVRGVGCSSFADVVKTLGFEPGDVVVRVRDLSSKLQLMLEGAKPDQVLRSDSGDSRVDLIMLCGISEGGELTADEIARIKHAAYTNKLVVASTRLMENMRKRHFIKRF